MTERSSSYRVSNIKTPGERGRALFADYIRERDSTRSVASGSGAKRDEQYLNDDLLEEDGEEGRNGNDPWTSDSNSDHRRDRTRSSPQRTPAQNFGKRLVIAIDYGTTFTGIAFAMPEDDIAKLTDVQVIRDWGPPMNNVGKIPSVYSYSPSSSSRQWGASISENAVTMVNTKLELDVSDKKSDELDLILQVLQGTANLNFDNIKRSRNRSDYPWKDPEDIVTDYLRKIFGYLEQGKLEVFRKGSPLRENISVDIVITVPVDWSYRARNSTIRAIKKAGFNEKTFPRLKDIIMISEPEAAAIYTARHLKEDKNTDFLQEGECFILCDAGGGTVDVVSYQVTKLEPTLKLRKITSSTSDKCGASYIDVEFKRWLARILGPRYYSHLDPLSINETTGSLTTEGKLMRQVISLFDDKKKLFSNKNKADVHVSLPAPLNTLMLPDRGLNEGELTIRHDQMKKLFDPSIDMVIELIDGQIRQVEAQGNRVQSVFLVGGFGESPYLQEELKVSLYRRKIVLRRPEKQKAWTAVVQGAALYGIEKAYHTDAILMKTSSHFFGLVLNETYSAHKFSNKDKTLNPMTNTMEAQKQVTWMIKKGDLISSDAVREKEIRLPFLETSSRKFEVQIWKYIRNDDKAPERFQTGRNEMAVEAVLKCDLSDISLSSFDRGRNPNSSTPYYIATFVCKFVMSGGVLIVTLWRNHTAVDQAQIKKI